MPHRFMDKHQPESADSYLSRLLKWCFQNKLDLPKQWVSEVEHLAKIKEIEANELKAIKLAEKVVCENAKFKTENTSLIEGMVEFGLWNHEYKERLEAIQQQIKEIENAFVSHLVETAVLVEDVLSDSEVVLMDAILELGVLLSEGEKILTIPKEETP